jgi:hypothetical protein
VIDAGPGKVHFRVQFTRYRKDGSAIGSYRSLYIVTFKDGRWAIQGRSSWAEYHVMGVDALHPSYA